MPSETDSLSPRDMIRLSKLIYDECGITLSADKQIMLEGRLKRRMSSLKLGSYKAYCDYLFEGGGQKNGGAQENGGPKNGGDELVHLLDAVSTNKTDFFREKKHFDYLVEKALPDIESRADRGREILIWSAGCSSGEEPYTLAIVLSEYKLRHPGFRFRLLATDISTAVLEKAETAVYTADIVRPVPEALRKKYFLRSRDRESNLLRVVPELRQLIEFRRLNLMEEFGFPELAHAIFCRNVIIYFDRPTQERLFHKMARQLVEGGYIFIGHSESLQHMNVPLNPVAPALYRKAHA